MGVFCLRDDDDEVDNAPISFAGSKAAIKQAITARNLKIKSRKKRIKSGRMQAVMWRSRKDFIRHPIYKFDIVVDPSIGVTFSVTTRTNGVEDIGLCYGVAVGSVPLKNV